MVDFSITQFSDRYQWKKLLPQPCPRASIDGVKSSMIYSGLELRKREFRHYLGGLLGESERKNVSQMARDSVEVTYHKLHHFLTEATWTAEKINERRLEVMSKSNQTRISRGFSLIVDDSGHRKSVSWCACVLWGNPRVVRSAILPQEWEDSILGKLEKQIMAMLL